MSFTWVRPTAESDCAPRPQPFACANGECAFFVQKCDGKWDCSDGSDEYGCRKFIISHICLMTVLNLYILTSELCAVCNGCKERGCRFGLNFQGERRNRAGGFFYETLHVLHNQKLPNRTHRKESLWNHYVIEQ